MTRRRTSQGCVPGLSSISPNGCVSAPIVALTTGITWGHRKIERKLTIKVLATLENMFLGQGLVWQQVWRHLERLGQAGAPDARSSSSYTSPGSLHDSTVRLRDSLTAVSRGQNGDACAAASAFDPSRPSKRRRVGAEVELNHHTTLPKDEHGLPPKDLVDTLVEIYFERIHPWIPMLHVRKFRQHLLDPVGRSEMSTVLHAITSLCVRFSDDPCLGDPAEKEALAKKSRETVILRSMESFSVKNLQALIICAFDIVSPTIPITTPRLKHREFSDLMIPFRSGLAEDPLPGLSSAVWREQLSSYS